MFILPNGVISRVEAICRNFLWDEAAVYMRFPLVAWEKICKPKEEGGLGLKDYITWNKATVGKLVWWKYTKSDYLWVKWVNHTYLRGSNLQDYSPPSDTSWYWRKLCQVKNLMDSPYQQGIWLNQKGKEYIIAKGYEYLRCKGDKVNWAKLVWNNMTVPKHSLVAWLYQYTTMNTNERVHKIGIATDITCYICGDGIENTNHLFFECEYSDRVVACIERWIGVNLPRSSILYWRLKMKGGKKH
ncbi:uncharacterized protein LOC141617920 [Silene latifolia]|uniref:uncharacterized protein LOC141617920 n=1 Tax=Silene latifolia TaxID=37657 RepID=UPI003D77697F